MDLPGVEKSSGRSASAEIHLEAGREETRPVPSPLSFLRTLRRGDASVTSGVKVRSVKGVLESGTVGRG